MRRIILAVVVMAGTVQLLSGCGSKIGGPRFWWDDRNQQRLPETYQLPSDVGAPADSGFERGSTPSGEDLSDGDLQDYRTNLDQQEEKRKSESSLLDF